MKNTVLYFLIIGFLLQSLSCKDDSLKGNVIEGYVLEYGTETPLADVQIDLVTCEGEIFGGLDCNKVDEFFTDQNGKFSFNFDQYAEDGGLVVFPKKVDGYYDFRERAINKGVNEFNLIADPESYIKIHVKNVDPFDWMDLIAFGGPWGGVK
jgi:hypothetical protein